MTPDWLLMDCWILKWWVACLAVLSLAIGIALVMQYRDRMARLFFAAMIGYVLGYLLLAVTVNRQVAARYDGPADYRVEMGAR